MAHSEVIRGCGALGKIRWFPLRIFFYFFGVLILPMIGMGLHFAGTKIRDLLNAVDSAFQSQTSNSSPEGEDQ